MSGGSADPVSREAARAIAETYWPKRVVRTVLDYSQIQGAKPRAYGVDLSSTWIAYFSRESDGSLGIFPSSIVAIDKETAPVVYAGCANDEG